MTDIAASDLARELNMPVAELLAKADKLIGDVVMRNGVDAARGLTTRIRERGQKTEVLLSPLLAKMLTPPST